MVVSKKRTNKKKASLGSDCAFNEPAFRSPVIVSLINTTMDDYNKTQLEVELWSEVLETLEDLSIAIHNIVAARERALEECE